MGRSNRDRSREWQSAIDVLDRVGLARDGRPQVQGAVSGGGRLPGHPTSQPGIRVMRLRSVRGRGLAVAGATAVLALGVPLSSASAQVGLPGAGNVQPGSGIGWAGCSGSNEPVQVGGPCGFGNGAGGWVTYSFLGP